MGARFRQALFLWALLCALGNGEASASDEFIAGYAAAILQHEFSLTDASVEVRDGVVVVTTKTLGNIDRGKVMSALQQVPGVSSVEIRIADPAPIPPIPGAVQTTIPTPTAFEMAPARRAVLSSSCRSALAAIRREL